MKKKFWCKGIFLCFFLVFAALQASAADNAAPPRLLPVTVEIAGVERLNDIASQPPFQKTDTLVFRVNFRLANPNSFLAKVEDLYFEAKVEDGTPDRTIVLTGSMPGGFLPPKGEIFWSWTEPYIYGGVFGSYLLRGVGGAEGAKGAAQKVEELWKDLGKDNRKFFVEGRIASSLPDVPNSGVSQQSFQGEFSIPKL